MPDGYSVDLDQFHGLDQAGATGLKDKVNNHYVEIFGASIALGVISGAAEAISFNEGYNETGSEAYRQGIASNSGMGSPTEFSTLNISEYPRDGAASSLSDILEGGEVLQRYYLSGQACRGILRRAGKRGKELPEALKSALLAVASQIPRPPSIPAARTVSSAIN